MTSHRRRHALLLAFSGGLDTSFCVPWLAETYGRPVITVTVDTGGIDAAAARCTNARWRWVRSSITRSMHAPTISSRCCAS
jgi:argininosuccinate synthase